MAKNRSLINCRFIIDSVFLYVTVKQNVPIIKESRIYIAGE